MNLKSRFNLGRCSKNESRNLAVKRTVSEYVKRSSIQGVAYVGDDKLNKFERVWWFVMFVCSVVGASYLIYQAYRTMKGNPIIESPSLTRTPMWEVPFPAVTFCPRYDLVKDFAETDWPDVVKDLPLDHFKELTFDTTIPIILESMLLRRSDQNNYDILTQVLPEIELHIANFRKVKAFLQNTITQIGLCKTFNMYPEKDLLRDGVVLSSLDDATDNVLGPQLWSRDSGFMDNLPLETYTHPFRLLDVNSAFFMIFVVNNSTRIFPHSSETDLIIHAPDEVPQFGAGTAFIRIKPGQGKFIEIKPKLVVSEGLEHYEPEGRQCYYSNERHLQFYKNYTQRHCENECIANKTLTQCGCVPYHLPHFGDTKLCRINSDFECYHSVENEIYLPNFNGSDVRTPIDACKCLSSCTQLSYEVARTTVVGERDIGSRQYVVSFNSNCRQIKKRIRTELHSISEFFSNCGGSLGLFLGVSVFSILELLYFCTVRLYLHSKRGPEDSNE